MTTLRAKEDKRRRSGERCRHCGHTEADHTEEDGGESQCPHCDCPQYEPPMALRANREGTPEP